MLCRLCTSARLFSAAARSALITEHAASGGTLLAVRALRAMTLERLGGGGSAAAPELAAEAGAWLAVALSVQQWEERAAQGALQRCGGQAAPALRLLLARDARAPPEGAPELSPCPPLRYALAPAPLLQELLGWAGAWGAALGADGGSGGGAVLAAVPDAAAAAEALLLALGPRLALMGPALARAAAFTSASASLRLPDSEVTLLGGRRLEEVKVRRMERRVAALRAERGAEAAAARSSAGPPALPPPAPPQLLLLGPGEAGPGEAGPGTEGGPGGPSPSLPALRGRAPLTRATLPLTLAHRMRRLEPFRRLPLFERAAVLRVESGEVERAAAAPLLAALRVLLAAQPQRPAAAAAAAAAAPLHLPLPQLHLWARLHSRALALALHSGCTATFQGAAQACCEKGAPLTSEGLGAVVAVWQKAAARAAAGRVAGSSAAAEPLVASRAQRRIAAAQPPQPSPRQPTASHPRAPAAAPSPILIPGTSLTASKWAAALDDLAALVLPAEAQFAPFSAASGSAQWGALHRIYTPLITAAGASGDLPRAFAQLAALQAQLQGLEAQGVLPAPRARPSPALLVALSRACAAAGQPRRAQQLLAPILAATPAPLTTPHAWLARQEIAQSLAAHGRVDEALGMLAALQAQECSAHRIAPALYSALCSALAAAGDAQGALTVLRCAQVAGALRQWDVGLGRGVLCSGGLPGEVLSVLLRDALDALGKAVRGGGGGGAAWGPAHLPCPQPQAGPAGAAARLWEWGGTPCSLPGPHHSRAPPACDAGGP